MSTLKVNTIQDTTGDNALTFDSSGNTTVAQTLTVTGKLNSVNSNGFPSVGAFSHRNLIINGAMTVHQRSAAQTGNGYTIDRWKCEKDGMDELAWSVNQSTESPAGFSNSLHVDITTAESTVNGNEYAVLQQRIEAQNLQQIGSGAAGAKSITLSFWVKSPKTGAHAVNINKADSDDRIISGTYTVSSANTWEEKSITFAGDTGGGGGIANDNGVGYILSFLLAAGSGITSNNSSSWIDWGFDGYAYGHAVNCVDNASNNFYLTGVQLEVGETATPFEHLSYGDQLNRCLRYYYRINADDQGDLGVAPGWARDSNTAHGNINFPVPMRANPSALETSGTPAHYSVAYLTSGPVGSSGPNFDSATQYSASINCDVSGTPLTAGQCVRIQAQTTDAYLGWSAEL